MTLDALDVENIDIFTIYCYFDVDHIEYTNPTKRPPIVISKVPEIENVEFIWNIDAESMNQNIKLRHSETEIP